MKIFKDTKANSSICLFCICVALSIEQVGDPKMKTQLSRVNFMKQNLKYLETFVIDQEKIFIWKRFCDIRDRK